MKKGEIVKLGEHRLMCGEGIENTKNKRS